MDALVEFYNRKLAGFRNPADAKNIENSKTAGVGVVLSQWQQDKLQLLVRVFLYYRSLITELVMKECKAHSPEWLSRLRYYAVISENDINVVIKVKVSKISP